MRYEPVEDYNRYTQPYRAFYHPYSNNALGYVIKLPVNYNPSISYPVMIWGGGNYESRKWWEYGIENGIKATNNPYSLEFPYSLDGGVTWPNDTTGNYLYSATWLRNDFSNFITIIPKLNDCPDWRLGGHTISKPAYDYYVYQAGLNHTTGLALRDLLINLINKTTRFYRSVDVDLEANTFIVGDEDSSYFNNKNSEDVIDLTTLNIDANRIFMGGYSGGAGTAFGCAMSLRDLLAGLFCLAGWPLSNAYSTYYNSTAMLERLEGWCYGLLHIPKVVSTASGNSMSNHWPYVIDIQESLYAEYAYPNTFWWHNNSDPASSHDWQWESQPISYSYRFDLENHRGQDYNTNPETDTNKSFKYLVDSVWNKPNNPAPLDMTGYEYMFGDLVNNGYTLLAQPMQSAYGVSLSFSQHADGKTIFFSKSDLEKRFGCLLKVYSSRQTLRDIPNEYRLKLDSNVLNVYIGENIINTFALTSTYQSFYDGVIKLLDNGDVLFRANSQYVVI